MSRDAIISYLTGVQDSLQQALLEVFDLRAIENLSPFRYSDFKHKLIVPLCNLFPKDLIPENARASVGGASAGLSPYGMAEGMLQRLAMGATPEEITDDFIDLFEHREGPITAVMSISGVSLPGKIRLSDDIQIVAAKDVPKSITRESVFGIDRFDNPIFDFKPLGRIFYPRAAILINSQWLLIREDEFHSSESDKFVMDNHRATILIVAALILSGNSPVSHKNTYYVGRHRAFSYDNLGANSGTAPFEPTNHALGNVDSEVVLPIFLALERLPEAVWKPLQLSISRLSRSRLHLNSTDRAIDLGIAIESALLHGETGIGAKGEMRNKIGTRGAWLISGDLDERRKNFKILTKAYDARSSAVHSGALGKGHHEVLPEADECCRKIMLKIAEQGVYPKWTDLVLGA